MRHLPSGAWVPPAVRTTATSRRPAPASSTSQAPTVPAATSAQWLEVTSARRVGRGGLGETARGGLDSIRVGEEHPADPVNVLDPDGEPVSANPDLQAVAGARYSVPWRRLEQTLDARVTETRVEFYRETELVKVHVRGQRGRWQIDDADLPAERIAFFRRTPQWCLEQAERVGPEVRAAVADLLQVRTNARLRQAQRILELEATYGPARLVGACARACAYGDPRYLTIKNILAAGLDQRPGEMPLWPLERPTEAGAFLRGASAFGAGSDPSPAGVAPALPTAGGGADTDSPSAPDDHRGHAAHTGPQCDGVHAAGPSHRPGTPPSARTRRVRRGRHTAVMTPDGTRRAAKGANAYGLHPLAR